MNKTKTTPSNLNDFSHTFLLFGAMLGLLALLGYALMGVAGVIWATVLGAGFLLFGPQMSPKVLLRFSKAKYLSRQDVPDLYRILDVLAHRADLPKTPELYYLPQPLMNAFAMGHADQAVIGVTAGLLRNLDQRELAGVLAHEMSHIRHRDTRVMGLAAMINQLTSMFASFGQILLFINLPLMLVGASTISWFAILLLMTAPTLNTLLQLALSRRREFAADASAAELTGDPEGLVNALQKLENQNRGFFSRVLMPNARIPEATLLRSHPKTSERVQRLRALPSYLSSDLSAPVRIPVSSPVSRPVYILR
ncbi:MAG: zinc metalloprotease HtpX [Chloroflexota bacterium]